MIPAFCHLDSEQMVTLRKYFKYRRYPSNARLFEQDDSARPYCLFWSGGVSVWIRKETAAIQSHHRLVKAMTF